MELKGKQEEKMKTERYVSPLSERYASKEMQYIFSQDKKFVLADKMLQFWLKIKFETGGCYPL